MSVQIILLFDFPECLHFFSFCVFHKFIKESTLWGELGYHGVFSPGNRNNDFAIKANIKADLPLHERMVEVMTSPGCLSETTFSWLTGRGKATAYTHFLSCTRCLKVGDREGSTGKHTCHEKLSPSGFCCPISGPFKFAAISPKKEGAQGQSKRNLSSEVTSSQRFLEALAQGTPTYIPLAKALSQMRLGNVISKVACHHLPKKEGMETNVSGESRKECVSLTYYLSTIFILLCPLIFPETAIETAPSLSM